MFEYYSTFHHLCNAYVKNRSSNSNLVSSEVSSWIFIFMHLYARNCGLRVGGNIASLHGWKGGGEGWGRW